MTAPTWAVALLRLLAAPGRAEDVLGDLHEVHGRRVMRRGPLIAKTLTAFDALDMALALFRQRVRREGNEILRGPDPGLGGDRNHNWRWQMRRWLEGWTRDFLHAARALRRAPGFTAVTVSTLALAIGANAAIFSVIDTVLLDPLYFPNADRLITIRASAPGSDLPEEFGVGQEFYVQYREADMLEDLGLYAGGQTTMRTAERSDRLFGAQATASFYSTLGVTPALGRLPTVEDASGSVGVISHWLWEDWFGADSSVIGRSWEVAGDQRTIVGVMGPEFRFPDDRIAFWMHAALGDETRIRPGSFGANLVARITPGTEYEDLKGQLTILASRLPERFGGPPRYARIIEQHRPIVRSLEETLVGDIAKPLWLLLGTVAIVLLIACANVANLFMVRAESRRRDFAVRQALGARPASLIRGQMAEALLLGALGGGVGALLAWVGIPLLVRAAPESIPNLDLTRLDATALLFTAGLSVLAACAFGLLPAIKFSRPHLVGALKASGKGGEARGHWSRNALVLVQTAAALVLLVGSGLLMRSFWTLSHVDPGYDTENIFSFQIAPQREELNDGPTFARFHEDFMQRVAGVPSVQSVGLVLTLPLDEGAGSTFITSETLLASGGTAPLMRLTRVGGDYFQTMGIALLQGRYFESSDHTVGLTNVIISASMAEAFWPGEDPIGKRLRPTNDSANWYPVVGVVENVFLEDFRQESADPLVYFPMVGPTARSWAVGSPAYVVKTPRAHVIEPDIRALIREMIPESPMYRIFTMEGLADRSMAQLSFTMLMLAIASGLALILGAIGLYGVLSYVVSNRASEIAVRMALGAEAVRVRRMVVRQGARVTLAGVGIGLVAALAATRVLDTMLFGVGKLDVVTFAVMSALMVLVALLASYIPARRAAAVDPMDSLRAE